MKITIWRSLATLVLAALLLSATSASAEEIAAYHQAIVTAVTNSHRDAKDQARDIYRHPVETLSFFELRPYQTVIELWPGAGWYTDILGPLLKEHGHLIAAHFPEDSDNTSFSEGRQKYLAHLQKEKSWLGSVEVVSLGPPNHFNLGIDNSADRVLTFRNTHNWINNGTDRRVFEAAFRVLKPGGVFGLTDHRANAGTTDVPASAKTGYVPEDYVIKLAESVGFRLLGRSEINANPDDTKNYPEGVWTLPPTYRLGDKDRAKYRAIGESDRMTLKFVKPFEQVGGRQPESYCPCLAGRKIDQKAD